jgi:RNA polymerase sigma factor (sigma-70 family)
MAETEEAVQRFLEGEKEAFSQIVCRWEGRIFNLAWRMLGNREDAQDVVQETFLSAFKSIRNLRDPRSFPTWLYQIGLNHCRARRRSRTSDISLDDSAFDQTIKELKAVPAGAELRHGRDSLETRDIIRKALTGLSEHHSPQGVSGAQSGRNGGCDGMPPFHCQITLVSRPSRSSP